MKAIKLYLFSISNYKTMLIKINRLKFIYEIDEHGYLLNWDHTNLDANIDTKRL